MLINGRHQDWVSAQDRGLQYGDGVFETIAVVDGCPCLWDQHLTRLHSGAARLGIPVPESQLIQRESRAVIGTAQRGVLKLTLTRGVGGRGYRPPKRPVPTRVLAFHPWPSYPASWSREGVSVISCQTRLGENRALAGIKHLNRLEQVLARAEWSDPAIAEGILRDASDRVVEGTMSNLFVWQGNGLLTPRLDRCGVRGLVRDLVLQIAAEQQIATAEAEVPHEDLSVAEAMFLTNSLIGIWPVLQLDGRQMNTRAIPKALLQAVRRRVFAPEPALDTPLSERE
jgi:4-amino-4-deoxychorismate lyase